MVLTGRSLVPVQILAALFFCCAVAGAAGVTSVPVTNPLDAAGAIYVSSSDVNPAVFYPYETGTVTVEVTNPTNASIGVSQPDLIDPHIRVLNTDTFGSTTTLGPGATTSYSFVIAVDGTTGDLYPLFTVSPTVYGATAIHSLVHLKVDDTDIRTSIASEPEPFVISKQDTVNVSILNPRDGDVSDVLVVPNGNGNDITPSEIYVGTLAAGTSVQVPFEITPRSASNVTFHVTFDNGDNKHATDLVLPLKTGADKTAVVPVVNDLAATSTAGYYELSGDVTNAGITDAKSMVITVGPPAVPVEPYVSYAVGTLASDDFSSFDLTFTAADLSAVPIIVTWKDADGNSFSATTTADLAGQSSGSGTRTGGTGSTGSAGTAAGGAAAGGFRGPGGAGGGVLGFGGGRGGGLMAFYPVITGFVIFIVVVAFWWKRKWIRAKLIKKR